MTLNINMRVWTARGISGKGREHCHYAGKVHGLKACSTVTKKGPRNHSCNNSLSRPSSVVEVSNWRRNLRSLLAEEPAIAIPDELDLAFRAHHGLVFRTAYLITGNAADAEDVLQTVFLRLLPRGRYCRRRRYGE